jgi:Spy/CpxP family protein refolding chaperone
MKKIVTVVLAFASFIFCANAQDISERKHPKHPHNNEMMIKELNLSSAQKEQMKANYESYKKQLMELNKNEGITVKEARDKKAALRKEHKEKMRSLLTAEQKNKLVQVKKDREARHEMMAAKKLEKLKTSLNLSDEQVAKINSYRKAIHTRLKAIHENEQLTRTEKKEQMTALKEENKNSFKNVLTSEQLGKMEEMKKSRVEKRRRG